MITMFKLFKGSYHLGHYFVPIALNMTGIWLLYISFIFILAFKWRHYLKIQNYIFTITVYTKPKLRLKAFLDTGNSLCMNHIPVIFLDSSYQHYFVNEKENIYSFNHLDRIEEIKVYLCDVQLKGHKKCSYYICCEKRILLEFNCRCLLNIEM